MTERQPYPRHQLPSAFTTASKWLSRIAGVLMVGAVLTIYALATRAQQLPPGHPWAGLCIGSLGLAQVIDTDEHSWVRIVIYGCGLAATLPWATVALGSF